MYHFCTYFDVHYLSRGLALYSSLKQHCSSFKLWVLCLDDLCYEILSSKGFPEIELIALQDFEQGDQALCETKKNRKLIEYYFTCTPSLPLYILKHRQEVALITYLDADLFFFSDPSPVFDEIREHSVGIIGHRFPPDQRSLEENGVYNVGWLSFRRDENAYACLTWWRKRCLEWCFDRHENGLFADQKYLDAWPTAFEGVVVIQHKGANLAPWNIVNYEVTVNGNQVMVDEQPLVFYHFHGFKGISRYLYFPNLERGRIKAFREVVHGIYTPYFLRLLTINKKLSNRIASAGFRGGIRQKEADSILPSGKPNLRYYAEKLQAYFFLIKGIIKREYILVWHRS